jgi:hypothetical protein
VVLFCRFHVLAQPRPASAIEATAGVGGGFCNCDQDAADSPRPVATASSAPLISSPDCLARTTPIAPCQGFGVHALQDKVCFSYLRPPVPSVENYCSYTTIAIPNKCAKRVTITFAKITLRESLTNPREPYFLLRNVHSASQVRIGAPDR